MVMEEEEPVVGIRQEGDEPKPKRRRTDAHPSPSRWKSPGEQRSYSSKLLESIRHVTRQAPPLARSAPPRSRAVREAADRVLAVAAKGRTRGSRAILSSCRALKLRKMRRVVSPGCRRPRKPPPPPPTGVAEKKVPAMGRKVRVLRRLVPGCRRLPLPSLLEETSDYIAALQMQVRAMSTLTEILSSLGGGGSAPQGGLGGPSSSAASSQQNL
uniref:Transcription factor bHLH148 n=1 Tax=Anthurium amnicola TaxID=1678845 RepID=A0A1D1YNF9_9ARAE